MSEEIPLEELARLPEFYHPAASPSGEEVAYYWDGPGRNELFVRDLATGEFEQWSDGEVPQSARWPVMWSGDGERIYYHSDEAGDEQNDVHALGRDGAHEVVVEMEGQCVLWDAGDDDRFLYFCSTAGEQMNLYRRDAEAGETTKLTGYDWPVSGVRLSPGGDRVAFVTNEADDLENRDVYVMDADGGEARNLEIGVEGSEAGVADWGPDGRRLLVSDNAEDLTRVGVYDLAAEEVEWYGPGEHEESPVAFTPDGDGALAHRIREGSVVPVHYDLGTGRDREFDLPAGVGRVPAGGPGGAFAADGDVLVAHSTPDARRQLLRYDRETGDREVVHGAEYGDVDPDAFVDAEYVTYEGEDGLEIGALLYDAREGPGADDGPTPAVVVVHGGPHAMSLRRFSPYVQFLVSRGYSVFQPNYRGSAGRGRAFKNAIHGDWGGAEQGDVAAGGRWLMDREWIDADRVAVYGGSYGGYSTYMQLVRFPELWAAGIASVGITDLHELYEEDMPHFKATLREQMGDPEANHDLWRERSPIEHVEEIERPLLIVHGTNDPRCPITQARLFRDALEERRGWTEGEQFEYVELDVGHGSTDPEYKVRVFRLMGAFLRERLDGTDPAADG